MVLLLGLTWMVCTRAINLFLNICLTFDLTKIYLLFTDPGLHGDGTAAQSRQKHLCMCWFPT